MRSKMVSDLDQVLQTYKTALEKLTAPDAHLPSSELKSSDSSSEPDSSFNTMPSAEARVLDVLIARDRIQTILNTLTTAVDILAPTKENLEKLHQLDTELRDHLAEISHFTQDDQWRSSFQPKETAWWWFLKPKEPSDPLNWFWSAVSLVSITASFSLLGDSIPRFLTGGPDLLGSFFLTWQSIFGLLSTGAVAKAIQSTSQTTIARRQLPKHWWGKTSAGLSLLFLISTVGLRLSLPYWSERYTNWGQQNYQNGNWSSAEDDYQRALKLNPDNAEAHFRLGLLYEDLQQADKALTQYQLAIQGNIPTAINNLARLHILKKKDYAAAVTLLLKALEDEKREPLKPATKHAVLKNLAWARLKQKNYPDAEAKLLDAIDLEAENTFEREAIADTHCLLAQVMEGLGDKKGALNKWRICNQNANITILEQDEWNAIAEQRLTPPEKRK